MIVAVKNYVSSHLVVKLRYRSKHGLYWLKDKHYK